MLGLSIKNIFVFAKMKKKSRQSHLFFSHPAGLPETELFLWTAWFHEN